MDGLRNKEESTYNSYELSSLNSIMNLSYLYSTIVLYLLDLRSEEVTHFFNVTIIIHYLVFWFSNLDEHRREKLEAKNDIEVYKNREK